MIYLELFWKFVQIGLFTIGGGYAALPLIKYHIVELNSYITLKEFIDIITIAESTPGPIAINSATFVGIKVAGIFGGIVSTLGLVTPSLIIVITLGVIYSKYNKLSVVKSILNTLRPVALGLISVAAVTIIILALFGSQTVDFKSFNFITLGMFGVGLFFLRKFKLNPIWIMLGCGLIGMLIYVFM